MRKITKGVEPEELSHYKKRKGNKGKTYADLEKIEEKTIRPAIRKACLEEQFYLCAYCCNAIQMETCHNEHILPQDSYSNKSLDFNNIVASCNNKKHCGQFKKNNIFPITPLQDRCETSFKYLLSGEIQGLDNDANSTLKILNLNEKGLVHQRKEFAETLIIQEFGSIDEINLEGDDLIQLMIDEQDEKVNGKLQAFAPVIKKILENYLS